jgi:hypothetical protein
MISIYKTKLINCTRSVLPIKDHVVLEHYFRIIMILAKIKNKRMTLRMSKFSN